MSERRVVIVCGPPCAGKSTYVEQHKKPGDLVVDYDAVAQLLGSPREHGHDYRFHKATETVIAQQLAAIERGTTPSAWVIRSLPREADREALALRLGAEVVLLDADDDVLIHRATARPDVERSRRAIMEWRRDARPISPHA